MNYGATTSPLRCHLSLAQYGGRGQIAQPAGAVLRFQRHGAQQRRAATPIAACNWDESRAFDGCPAHGAANSLVRETFQTHENEPISGDIIAHCLAAVRLCEKAGGGVRANCGGHGKPGRSENGVHRDSCGGRRTIQGRSGKSGSGDQGAGGQGCAATGGQ